MPPDARWTLAFDLGGTSTKLALVAASGEMRAWTSLPTQSPRDSFLQRLTAALLELASQAEPPPTNIAGAIAGFLSSEGALVYNPNLPWLEGVNFRTVLAQEFDLPVHLENDANAACAGEFLFGAGRGSRRFLCLTAGTGIGVGLIAAGELVRCAFGGLGDAGHVVIAPGGPLCACGGHGCAETLVSTVALAQQHSDATGQRHSFRNLVEAVRSNNPAALSIVSRAGHHLGIALASLAQIFFPDRIAIAGGLSALGEPLLTATRASFAKHVGTLPGSATLVGATHGPHATLAGAVASTLLHGSASTQP